jgi:hypothetical protein
LRARSRAKSCAKSRASASTAFAFRTSIRSVASALPAYSERCAAYGPQRQPSLERFRNRAFKPRLQLGIIEVIQEPEPVADEEIMKLEQIFEQSLRRSNIVAVPIEPIDEIVLPGYVRYAADKVPIRSIEPLGGDGKLVFLIEQELAQRFPRRWIGFRFQQFRKSQDVLFKNETFHGEPSHAR